MRVIQAYFAGGRPPLHLVTRTYLSPWRTGPARPHPATVAQPAVAPHAATLGLPATTPHPRATAQQKRGGVAAARAPHAATLQAKDGRDARPPHPATLQRRQSGPRDLANGAVPGSRSPAAGSRAQARGQAASGLGDGEVHAFRTPDGFLDEAAGRGEKQLPPAVRHKMETFFEVDFSDVRIHVGPEAGAIGAIAFTIGSDIYFAPGQYEPDSPRGQELLGHELTHVVQQREGRVENPFEAGVAVVQDQTLEDEADHMGRLVAAQKKAAPTYRHERQQAPRATSPAGRAGGGAEPPPAGRERHAAQRQRAGYQLVVGAYLHEGDGTQALPEPLAGHAFVALEGPGGERQAWGFSPANFGSYDPNKDLGKLSAGVEGVVHDDATAFARPGVRTRTYAISEEQARAAKAKVAEYEAGKYAFSLKDRQCSAFAVDVLKAAHIEDLGGLSGRPPREVHRKL